MPDIPYHYIPEYEFSTVPDIEDIIKQVKSMI